MVLVEVELAILTQTREGLEPLVRVAMAVRHTLLIRLGVGLLLAAVESQLLVADQALALTTAVMAERVKLHQLRELALHTLAVAVEVQVVFLE